jgi:hypothetical protein
VASAHLSVISVAASGGVALEKDAGLKPRGP